METHSAFPLYHAAPVSASLFVSNGFRHAMSGFLGFLLFCAIVGVVGVAFLNRRDVHTEWYWSDDE